MSWKRRSDSSLIVCAELRDYCTWTWTNDYKGTGVAGMIVTSNVGGYEDKSIFLPAAGLWNGNGYFPGSHGVYWSSSLDGVDTSEAWSIHFSSRNAGRYISNRSEGYSVRSVSE